MNPILSASLFAFAATLTACASIPKDAWIPASFHAMEFNEVTSHYLERPTSVAMERLDDGRSVLVVHMDGYEPGVDPRFGPRFLKEAVPQYVAAINKYLQWAALAKQRGEVLVKDIATLPSVRASEPIKFSFSSGNVEDPYLRITLVAGWVTLDKYAQSYDEDNARKLREVLLEFAAGSLHETDESVYK